MKSNDNGRNSSRLLSVVVYGVCFTSMFFTQSVSAGFDYMFFSVNGDTTISTMTQGDALGWGSNCDLGASIHWAIWYDVNSNSVIDPSIDVLLSSESITDGDGITDSDPVADGWIATESFRLTIEPGDYIFKATDMATDSSLQKIATVLAMSSPPNQISGQVIIPGITAPNSLLANIVIEAENAQGDENFYLTITDNMGAYSLNVGVVPPGSELFFDLSDVSGFVAPTEISAVVSGIVANVNFTYLPAVDSVWGIVKDEMGSVIPFETEVEVDSELGEKSTFTKNGRYVMYFSILDNGFGVIYPPSSLSPVYLAPGEFGFNHDTLTSFQHDITLIKTNAVINVRIRENGGLPANNYSITARSAALSTSVEAVSGTGLNNVVQVPVSTSDNSGWQISLNLFDDDFPIPAGLLVVNPTISNVSPGDMVTINLVNGKLISDTITQDPGDGPIDWDEVFMFTRKETSLSLSFVRVGAGGVYSLFTDTGSYVIGIVPDGYIGNPAFRNVIVTADTTGGLGFEINETHARVSGTLTNVSLPLNSSLFSVFAQIGTGPINGYFVSVPVDSSTGTYAMKLSDGDWTIFAPNGLPNVLPPAPAIITIGESPDTIRTVNFAYTRLGCCVGVTGNVDCDPGSVVDIADLTTLIDHLFIGLQPLCCREQGNVDGDIGAVVDIADLTFLIDHLFISLVATSACR